jgi:GNAT superfamily N-acetyltransferase
MKLYLKEMSEAVDLVDVYNDQIGGVPYCYNVSPGDFEVGIRLQKDGERPHDKFRSETMVVAEEGSKVIGYANACILDKIEIDGVEKEGGLIRFLTCRPGYREHGQAILAECERYLRDLGAEQFYAFQQGYNYLFCNFTFGIASYQRGHIYGLFGLNGYKPDNGEIIMDQLNFCATEPELTDVGVHIEVKENHSRASLPGLWVRAIKGDREIGECWSVPMGKYSQTDETEQTFLVEWIGVDEKERGKGWGRYLLARTFWEAQRIGYRHSLISTDRWNYRALLFYTNYGYRVVDTTYSLAKTVS